MAPFLILTGIGILMISTYLIVDRVQQNNQSDGEMPDEPEVRSIRRHRPAGKAGKEPESRKAIEKEDLEWYDSWIETQMGREQEPGADEAMPAAAPEIAPDTGLKAPEEQKPASPEAEAKEVYRGKHAAAETEEEPIPAPEPVRAWPLRTPEAGKVRAGAADPAEKPRAEEAEKEELPFLLTDPLRAEKPKPVKISPAEKTEPVTVTPVLINPAENREIGMENITWREPEPQQSGMVTVLAWICGIAIAATMLLTGLAALLQMMQA